MEPAWRVAQKIGGPEAGGPPIDCGAFELEAAKAGLREGCRHRMDVWDRCARFLTTTPAVGAPSGMP